MSDARRMSGRWLVVLFAAIVLVAAGVGLALHALPESAPTRSVPDATAIRNRAAVTPYLVEASDLEGRLLDLDLGALVFRFRTGSDAATWWRIVEERAAADGWVIETGDAATRTFVRGRVGLAGRARARSEELRLHRAAGDDRVTVGHVGLEFDGAPERPAESRLADRLDAEVWTVWDRTRRER